ncbi:hypothetical protein BaRGS_00017191 [Batillaria attramentaria]|uniref:Uncharacterized protein n=1 Tax=Batillaria attramentaria TaxID=370345 RepID=A0ABD0KWE0_9CAEN
MHSWDRRHSMSGQPSNPSGNAPTGFGCSVLPSPDQRDFSPCCTGHAAAEALVIGKVKREGGISACRSTSGELSLFPNMWQFQNKHSSITAGGGHRAAGAGATPPLTETSHHWQEL